MNAVAEEVRDLESVKPDAGVLAALSRAEIDTQITTARAFPRSIRQFMTDARDMVTLTETIASSCIYAVPRKENGQTKMIEGPSARFAEMVVHAWGNCRAGARVVAEESDFVVAQGVFHDLEKNTCITYEVKRSIRGKRGRFSQDMIGVTGNAACSIALRNAVLKGVPKSFWQQLYEEARRAAVGDVKTLANKRSDMLAYFQKMGVTVDMVLARLEVPGIEDIGLDELAQLKGLATAIKEGELTVEQAFAGEEPEPRPPSDLEATLAARGAPKRDARPAAPGPAGDGPLETFASVKAALEAATNRDELDAAADRASLVADKAERTELNQLYREHQLRIEQAGDDL